MLLVRRQISAHSTSQYSKHLIAWTFNCIFLKKYIYIYMNLERNRRELGINNGNSSTPAIVYLTGWRYAAVGIPIVMSMFLASLDLVRVFIFTSYMSKTEWAIDESLRSSNEGSILEVRSNIVFVTQPLPDSNS